MVYRQGENRKGKGWKGVETVWRTIAEGCKRYNTTKDELSKIAVERKRHMGSTEIGFGICSVKLSVHKKKKRKVGQKITITGNGNSLTPKVR